MNMQVTYELNYDMCVPGDALVIPCEYSKTGFKYHGMMYIIISVERGEREITTRWIGINSEGKFISNMRIARNVGSIERAENFGEKSFYLKF